MEASSRESKLPRGYLPEGPSGAMRWVRGLRCDASEEARRCQMYCWISVGRFGNKEKAVSFSDLLRCLAIGVAKNLKAWLASL